MLPTQLLELSSEKCFGCMVLRKAIELVVPLDRVKAGVRVNAKTNVKNGGHGKTRLLIYFDTDNGISTTLGVSNRE